MAQVALDQLRVIAPLLAEVEVGFFVPVHLTGPLELPRGNTLDVVGAGGPARPQLGEGAPGLRADFVLERDHHGQDYQQS